MDTIRLCRTLNESKQSNENNDYESNTKYGDVSRSIRAFDRKIATARTSSSCSLTKKYVRYPQKEYDNCISYLPFLP